MPCWRLPTALSDTAEHDAPWILIMCSAAPGLVADEALAGERYLSVLLPDDEPSCATTQTRMERRTQLQVSKGRMV